MNDKIAEIRARHEAGPHSKLPPMGDPARVEAINAGWRTFCAEADADRATLLAEDARHRAENERLRAEIKRLRTDRRERIATAALQGILACQEGNTALPKEWPGIFAIMSVGCADALIAELDKEGKP